MEESSESQATKDNFVVVVASKKSDKKLDWDYDVVRQRNLLLLSALHYLYGNEWEQPADWMKVTVEIQNAKIPGCGIFSPEICQELYYSLLNNGYHVGIGPYSVVRKAPESLNEAQKRLWILAKTSTDIYHTSQLKEQAMRILYKKEFEEIEKINSGSNIKLQALAKVSVDMESEKEGEVTQEEESDDPKVDTNDLGQSELMQEIKGLQDVLLLSKYCYIAAEFAVKKYPSLEEYIKMQTGDCATGVSSLMLHDAANEESTEALQKASEKAVSESSHSVKEKTKRRPKSSRVEKLLDWKNLFYGESDDGEETPNGKRLTRNGNRPKMAPISHPIKRSKPPSVGELEGMSKLEPACTKSTRRRFSSDLNMPILEPINMQQIDEDEEHEIFRKNALNLFGKLEGSESATLARENLQEDALKEWNTNLARIKSNIETGKVPNITNLQKELNMFILCRLFEIPCWHPARELVLSFFKLIKSSFDELRAESIVLRQKNDSNGESIEPHYEQSSEASSEKTSGGGRRKGKISASETSEGVQPKEKERQVTRTSTSSITHQGNLKTKRSTSPDIVSFSPGRQ